METRSEAEAIRGTIGDNGIATLEIRAQDPDCSRHSPKEIAMPIAQIFPPPPRTIANDRAAKPGPPSPEVAAAIEAGIRSRRHLYPTDAPVRTIELWSPPQIDDSATAKAIRERLRTLETATRPGSHDRILSCVVSLLANFPGRQHHPAIEENIVSDWTEDLAEFPIWAIDDAARSWRRTKQYRPRIAEILELCQQACGDAAKERDRLREIVARMDPTPGPISG
jgi:hypothetical protein